MKQESYQSTGETLIDELADWLIARALVESKVEEIVEGCAQRLLAAGVPIWRAYVSFRTLHPLFASHTLIWRRGQTIDTMQSLHGDAFSSKEWLESPHLHMLDVDIPYMRRHLVGEEALLDFAVLEEFRDQGATDYLAYVIPFDRGDEKDLPNPGLIGSWMTDRPSGFSERDVQTLTRIQARLAVTCKMTIKEQLARNVLAAYLGPGAGKQVLNGRIKRGDGEQIHAVIWFSDLRKSTELAESMPLDAFLGVLNDFFEAVAGSVLDHGGEVLRFIGDAALAIFPITDIPEDCDPPSCPAHRAACEQALAAARDAVARMQALNARRENEGEEALGFGIALHVGDVMFGNIGTPGRVEFSVTGPAANMAARIESMCKILGRPLLFSDTFAAILPEQLESVGRHRLEGMRNMPEIFSLPGL